MEDRREAVVETHARLHLGFLDLNFGLGRQFGSLGVALERPVTRVRIETARRFEVAGEDAERAAKLAETFCGQAAAAFAIAVEEAIPVHAGLGSGTQLALAIGAGIKVMQGQAVQTRALSQELNRGARSGIGIGVFEQGGFLVDGGRKADDAPAPLIARMEFPEDWRILLVFDKLYAGVHGAEEHAAFAKMPRAPANLAGKFCRRTLMQILPSIAELHLAGFSEGIRAIQDGMGALFAPYQGGSAFRSPRVAQVLAWINAQGVNGTGQSSWGPTGFAFLACEEGVLLLEKARQKFRGEDGLSFELVSGCNRGASIIMR